MSEEAPRLAAIEDTSGRAAAGNSAVILAARLVSTGINALGLILITRYLQPERFGTFAWITAYVAAFQLCLDFGLANILTREMSAGADQTRRLLAAGRGLSWAVALVILPAMLLIAVLWRQESTVIWWGVALQGATSLMIVQTMLLHTVFRSYQRMKWEAFTLYGGQVVYLLGVFAAINLDGGIPGVIGANLAGFVAQYVIARSFVSRRFVSLGAAWDAELWKRLALAALPLGAALLLRRIFWQVDVLILDAMSTERAVGLFSSAYRLIWGLAVIPNSLVVPLFPVLSRLSQGSADDFRATCTRSLRLLVAVSVPIAALLAPLAQPVVATLFGEKYAASGPALAVLSFALVLLFPTSLFLYVFTARHQQRRYAVCVGLALLLNIGLDVALIPTYDHLGPCYATVAGEALLFVLAATMLRREVGFAWVGGSLRAVVAGGIVGAAVSVAPLPHPAMSLLWMAVGGALYLVLIWLFRVFSAEEVAVAIVALRGRGRSKPGG